MFYIFFIIGLNYDELGKNEDRITKITKLKPYIDKITGKLGDIDL